MLNIVSQESMLEARRKANIETQIPFILNGKKEFATKKIVNGEMETLKFNKPLGEMISYGGTNVSKELLRKVVLDVELGREEVQPLYSPIYDTISDPNLPEILDAKWALRGACVFMETVEGGEVKFGTMQAEYGPTARIVTYTAGFEYTKQMKDFNQSFQVEMLNKALGQSYNALLNHIHLSPFINFSYKSANKTAYAGTAEDISWVRLYNTIKNGMKAAIVAKRTPTVMLASKANQIDIEMALRGGYQINGTNYPAINGINTIIYYDGWEETVGKKNYEYKGCPADKIYLVRPKRGFKELLKQDLRIEANTGDLTRLIQEQIVGYAYRGVFAAVEENVQELTIA
ncbi:MAG: aspartate ammonia-lyase [Megamonas funiformis]|jgi:hypothetical protein|nr:aspartate ammonia-lyase [Megamonas funiformis]DAO85056.1 MAG TPA: major capsid protein [Caudoviricetes sp.]